MGWKSRSELGRLSCSCEENIVSIGRRSKGQGGKPEGALTFSCTRREGAGVDKKVLAVVEQAHSCG